MPDQLESDEHDDDAGEPSMMNKLAVVIHETPPLALIAGSSMQSEQ